MTSKLKSVLLGALLLVASSIPAAAYEYQVLGIQTLPGPVKWDYLIFDAAGQRLFVTRGDHVDVVDPKTLAVIGSIPGEPGIHGVALAPELGKGFYSNGKTGAVTVFDFKTLKTLGTVKAEDDADSIVYDPATARVFTANGDSGSVAAIDAKLDKNIGSIKLSGKPEYAAVDGKGRLFVNIEDKSQLDVIDTRTLKLLSVYELSPACKNPSGLAIDAAGERLFSGCRGGTIAVTDGNTGKVLAAPPIGEHNDAAQFDAGRQLAFASNGDGTLTMIATDGANKYQVVQTVKTAPGARTMALDPQTHTVYLVTAAIDHVDAPTAAVQHPRSVFKEGSFEVVRVGER